MDPFLSKPMYGFAMESSVEDSLCQALNITNGHQLYVN